MVRSLEPFSANHVPAAEKQEVAPASVVTSAMLVALKLVVGPSTHSLGILSEAAHSSLDLVAAGRQLFLGWSLGQACGP
jgi:divalent metal cation (Fe/Co/Zn/Cd) transporter